MRVVRAKGEETTRGEMLTVRSECFSDCLNPNRQKGFGAAVSRKIETPTLNDMRARQGASVGKFMSFMHRKNTIVIDLYNRAFYSKRPSWEGLANFVYNDLCPSADLRSEVLDVQLHPVKMMLFVKFKSETRWWTDFRHQMGYCGQSMESRLGDIVWMLQ